MADKSFGIKQLNLIGASGTPKIDSPNNLNLNANTVAISTNLSIGGKVTSNLIVDSLYSVGIGSTLPTAKLDVLGSVKVSGISTIANVRITPVGTGATIGSAGIVTYYGDGSQLSGVSAAGYQFNTGITTSISTTLTGIGTTVITLPSTANIEYIIHSINASNIAVGNTDVNVIGAFDMSAGERSYFAYNIPIPTGTSVELLKQPMILGPSERITMRATDYNRDGTDTGVQVYISYQVSTNTNYFGVGVGSVSIATTSPTTIYTSSNSASVLQSIRLVNRTDSGGYPVSIAVTTGLRTTYLVDDLIVPKYASVELLDNPKSIPANSSIQVIVDQTSTIDVQVSGIKL